MGYKPLVGMKKEKDEKFADIGCLSMATAPILLVAIPSAHGTRSVTRWKGDQGVEG